MGRSGRAGKLIVLRRTGESQIVARGLHCPMGVCRDAGRQPPCFPARARQHRRCRGRGSPLGLSRLSRAHSPHVATGYAIACLSRRDPLIEFLKSEKEFVAEMKASIEPRHWISPRATPQFSHDFPIELGATRLFGEVKPWAPSFSYGLVIETDDRLMPVGSAHSRANGRRHAIMRRCRCGTAN